MRLVLRADAASMRKVFSVAGSAALHGAALGWVLLSAVPEGESGVYDLQIRPHATRIVWYSLKQTLPPISPPERPEARPRDAQPARALTHAPHTLVVGKQDLLRPPQLIWTPAPPLKEPSLLPSPNIVALTPPERLQPRAFVAEPELAAKAPAPVLPAAPELAAAIDKNGVPKDLLPPVARARKTFIPPLEAVHQPQPPPEVVPEAPKVEAENRPQNTPLAIVGLFPSRRPETPAPKASQEAGFSAGPQSRPIGSNDLPDPSQLVIPGLLARSSAPPPNDRQSLLAAVIAPPTSARNLLAAATNLPRRNNGPGDKLVGRVTDPPDPRLRGRVVYSMALQMPNITSYSGSWLVWFAERGTSVDHRSATPSQDLTPPSPVRKVDPKYDPAAVEDRVEGTVRLSAVIRKDGAVDTVEVLHSLDSRLDRRAAEALAKWEFEPAQRDGSPVDVDAVFEIPFHLAPHITSDRPSK